MTDHSSTIHPCDDLTVEEPNALMRSVGLEAVIANEWQEASLPDLVGAISKHPEVLENRSVLLNLALLEYRERRTSTADIGLEEHCRRFRPFGRAVEQSIFRQLETQQYLDEHPEILDLLDIPKWPEVGEVFGTFHLVEELGSGGIARVYLATQEDLGDRTVVVKATPYSSYEASILGRLNHPHIVPIHFADEVQQFHLSFLCMPYCGRSTLVDLLDLAFEDGLPRDARIVRAAALRWLPRHEKEAAANEHRHAGHPGPRTYIGAILRIASRIADALQYSHQQGIVHGDLKPSNVLLTPAGEPLLLDFNLSRDESAPTTVCGGTLAYMPPEQLRQIAAGSAATGEVLSGPSADIYSFGALLYELLGGRPPVAIGRQYESPQAAAKALLEQLDHPPLPLRQRNPQVPSGIDALIMQCLAPEPQQRPASMKEVSRRLAAHTGWTAESLRRIRRRPWLVAASTLLMATVVAAAGISAVNQPSPQLALYHQGIAAQDLGEWKQAEDAFHEVLSIQPSYNAARLELGRCYLAQEEFDLAISTLTPLAFHDEVDPRVVELIAYTYNLKMLPTAAIAWYERSLAAGGHSLATFNNLAASYLSGYPKLALKERLRLQELYLEEALKIDPTALAVRLNWVRHAVAKSIADPSYDPREVAPLVQQLRSSSADPAVDRVVTSWEHVIGLKTSPQKAGTRDQTLLPMAMVAHDRTAAPAGPPISILSSAGHAKSLTSPYIKPELAP